MDARPFLTLYTPGGSCRCLRPALRPLVLGIGGQAGTVAQDAATHTIDVPAAITTPPTDLLDNVLVTVDVQKGRPREAFRVLRNGIDRGAGLWTLYVRADGEDAGDTDAPAQASTGQSATPQPETGYHP